MIIAITEYYYKDSNSFIVISRIHLFPINAKYNSLYIDSKGILFGC